MNDIQIEEIRIKYINALKPLLFPEKFGENDIVQYFSSLLRVNGAEDTGWDPYLESKSILEDLNSLLNIELPREKFLDVNLTKWRLGLLLYTHIVEMDAIYEVIMNLLRFRLGKGYSANPYLIFLSTAQQKNYAKKGLYPTKKIELIKKLSKEANLEIGDIFDEFYNNRLRNSISHSDYILTESEFRSRDATIYMGAFRISLKKLNEIISKAKIFLSTFFSLEYEARKYWGTYKQQAIPYDPDYKGLIEILVDEHDIMCGFKVHWPNNSESIYRRTKDGCNMCNIMLVENFDISLFVDRYARNPGNFSPLVEQNEQPQYTKLEGCGKIPIWFE